MTGVLPSWFSFERYWATTNDHRLSCYECAVPPGNREVSFISRGVLGIGFIAPGAVFRTDRIGQDVDLVTARVNYRFGGPVIPRF